MKKGGVVFLSKRRYLELVENEKHVSKTHEISDILKRIESIVSSAVSRGSSGDSKEIVNKIDELKILLRNISMSSPSLAMTTPPNANEKIEVSDIDENIELELEDDDIDILLGE